MQKADGMNYAPVSQGKKHIVCGGDTFPFGVIGLDHGHIFAMCNGLLEAGAKLGPVYDPDPEKVRNFCQIYPQARPVSTREEVLEASDIKLIAAAPRPDLRSGLGIMAMGCGKDIFVDKPGMLTLDEVEQVRACCQKTGRKYMVYFGERIHVEGALFAQELIRQGRIGRVLQVTILAPHRLNKSSRPDWFFERSKTGGIITDIGSHQIEQFLTYTGEERVEILKTVTANYANPEHPEFEDFGEGILKAEGGATCYFRVDWFTPDGLGAWGDGRVFIVGTEGTIEIRKYLNVGEDGRGDNVILVDGAEERKFCVTGEIGYYFFGDFILDCMERTERSITQEHVFNTMRTAIEAQMKAQRI